MRQILTILAVISSVISFCYIAPHAWSADALPHGDFAEMRRVKQAEVIDVISPMGLLLRDGSIARLSGIDVPGSYGDEVSALAVVARDVLKDLMVGKRVHVYQSKHKKLGLTNRMGHSLVHLARMDNDAWAQGTLLALGLARVKTSAHNAHMAAQMLETEAQARKAKAGIWADDAYRVFNTEDAGNAIGSFAIIEGRIESVAIKKNRIYMNFGKDWKTDFTVSIAPEDKRQFSKALLDPLGWGGRMVRVRGSLREYNGAYMEVSHPEAIEFIGGDHTHDK